MDKTIVPMTMYNAPDPIMGNAQDASVVPKDVYAQLNAPSGPPPVRRDLKPPSDEECARCDPDKCKPDLLLPQERRIIGEGTNERRDIRIKPNTGGKKRKRKTLRKSKKSKSMRKHRKTNKKHAKRHSKTMKRKGKQHHKRSKKHHKKSRK